MKVKIFIGAGGKVPTRGTPYSAGYDIFPSEPSVVSAGTRAVVPTNLRVEIPWGYYLKLKSRSGLAIKWIDTEAGVIDADFRGPIGVVIHNHSDKDLQVNPQTAITQCILQKFEEIDWEVVETKEGLSKTGRGDDGWGSTDIPKKEEEKKEDAKEVEVMEEEEAAKDSDNESVDSNLGGGIDVNFSFDPNHGN